MIQVCSPMYTVQAVYHKNKAADHTPISDHASLCPKLFTIFTALVFYKIQNRHKQSCITRGARQILVSRIRPRVVRSKANTQ